MQSCYESIGQGPPLLLFNGLGFSRWSWSWQWNSLPGLRLLAIENRGVGGSALAPFELADLADDGARLLDRLGLERAHIWGVSMGGMIAQEFALKHPDRCAGLILGCTMAGGPSATYMGTDTLEFMARLAREGLTDASVRGAMRLNFSDSVDPGLVDRYVALRMSHNPPLETWTRQREATARFDASSRLHAYRGPALLMHGGDDQVVPSANLAVLQRLLPQAQVHSFPHARHLFWIEHAPEVNQLVRNFVLA
ncbi:MAG: alpha/beta fold hydrolase [Candidatus Eremiobacteraeota bacterium]|nr:alpha/beta fold hydrolase [Candidatus Eremiobacteraeota bacterium]MCW5871636.1 alpha/beta fold hydrolase [Candidatus Eremiobacteraeota bacterium]